MNPLTIRGLIATTLKRDSGCEWPEALEMASALLVSPLAEIVNLAADWAPPLLPSPEVRALLADWRASR